MVVVANAFALVDWQNMVVVSVIRRALVDVSVTKWHHQHCCRTAQ